MNYSLAVFLINPNARAVLCTYEPPHRPDDHVSTKPFKTLDPDVAVGDYVVVATDTRHGMTVNKVVEVDVDLDFDMTDKVHWIIRRVDNEAHLKLLQDEEVAIAAIKSAELRKKREDLRKTMFADHVETLKALPLALINGDDEPSDGE